MSGRVQERKLADHACRCGRLEDVPDAWFAVAVPAGVAPPFSAQRFHVVAEGTCAACADGALP